MREKTSDCYLAGAIWLTHMSGGDSSVTAAAVLALAWVSQLPLIPLKYLELDGIKEKVCVCVCVQIRCWIVVGHSNKMARKQ